MIDERSDRANEVANIANEATNAVNEVANAANRATNAANEIANAANKGSDIANEATNAANEVTNAANEATNATNEIANRVGDRTPHLKLIYHLPEAIAPTQVAPPLLQSQPTNPDSPALPPALQNAQVDLAAPRCQRTAYSLP